MSYASALTTILTQPIGYQIHFGAFSSVVRRIMARLKVIVWIDEAPCDILIYDAEGSEMLQQCMPSLAKVRVLETRQSVSLIKSPRFFLLFVSGICKYKKPRYAIVVSILHILRPKVIISYIDNSGDLGNIKQSLPWITAISVQNGSRNDWLGPEVLPLTFEHYFSFGEMERDLISRCGHRAAHVHPVGSLRAGIFAATIAQPRRKEFDLCFVSEFMSESERPPRPDNSYQDRWSWTNGLFWAIHETHRELLSLVAEYSAVNGISLCIAMRNPSNSPKFKEERNFLSLKSGSCAQFIPQSGFSSYEAVRASRLTVTLASTLGYEALGLGERVIIATDTEAIARYLTNGAVRKNFGAEGLGSLQRLHTLDYEEFSSKADALLGMGDEAYATYSKSARAYLMNLDMRDPPQEIIKRKISKHLSPPNPEGVAV